MRKPIIIFAHLQKNFNFYYFASFILLIIVCLPRFNQNNFWIIKDFVGNNGHLSEFSIDVKAYIALVEYFRGVESQYAEFLSKPYSFRVLPALIASFLPFSAFTSINVINLSANLFSLFFLFKIQKYLNINKSIAILTNSLFIFSFPVFYFGATGVIDPLLILFLCSGLFFIISNKIAAFAILIFLSALVKETAIILIPVYMIYQFKSKFILWKTLSFSVLFLSSTFFIARKIVPVESTHFFLPSIDFILDNLSRKRAYFSYIIAYSYFLPIIFFLYNKIQAGNLKYALIAGIILGNGIFFYSFVAAYPDARLIWPAYPFSIIFVASGLNNYFKSHSM